MVNIKSKCIYKLNIKKTTKSMKSKSYTDLRKLVTEYNGL